MRSGHWTPPDMVRPRHRLVTNTPQCANMGAHLSTVNIHLSNECLSKVFMVLSVQSEHNSDK